VPTVLVRPFSERDIPEALALNNASVPDLNELDENAMRRLLEMADTALVAEWVAELVEAESAHGSPDNPSSPFAGFCWVMTKGQPYDSLNYRWFSERYEQFVYLDRITVMPHARRAGVGRALYAHLINRYRGVHPVLTCEVNLVPRNDTSLRFHAGLGFVEVGQQHTGPKQVSLLALEL
jgi:predicted GNAT superfamily acetyltransferase